MTKSSIIKFNNTHPQRFTNDLQTIHKQNTAKTNKKQTKTNKKQTKTNKKQTKNKQKTNKKQTKNKHVW